MSNEPSLRQLILEVLANDRPKSPDEVVAKLKHYDVPREYVLRIANGVPYQFPELRIAGQAARSARRVFKSQFLLNEYLTELGVEADVLLLEDAPPPPTL